MADYEIVTKHFPAMAFYLRPGVVRRQGERVTYRPNVIDSRLNTDTSAIRRTSFGGTDFTFSRNATFDKFDLLAGSSHIFGFGLQNDSETLASRLSDEVGRPVFSLALPEADTRDLIQFFRTSARKDRTTALYLASGGTFSRFCIFGQANPIDGPPALVKAQSEEFMQRCAEADTDASFDFLVKYQLRTIRNLAELAVSGQVGFFLLNERTFFDKTAPSAYEAEAKLGEAAGKQQALQFERMRAYQDRYRTDVIEVLRADGISVLDYPPADELSFIDEYHPDAASIARIAVHIAAQRPST